ncbi:MAG TPA: tetratricopeptide repeat protein [Solirubrobacteraceae bacterium]|nr:tetratricopeptide repeat protein [Solirubrobacteraceae bacterium]
MDDVYELFSRGSALLADGHFHQAAVPLRRASQLSPESTSIREALGRALFQSQHYSEAADEFRAVVERAPTNDYALFCLGRSLQMLGRHAEARQPLALAATMKPDRSDYRAYRDRARSAAERTAARTEDLP